MELYKIMNYNSRKLNEIARSSLSKDEYLDKIIDRAKTSSKKRAEKYRSLSCRVHESKAKEFNDICKRILGLSSSNKLFMALVDEILERYGKNNKY
ncbi:MAG: hypothetical protein K2L48_04500 [Mycoplasmoidaceae bacterium]|nr:hypothetical protein [Mycoplasmoidaceae bacterium]